MKFEIATTNHWPDVGSKEPMRLVPPDKERSWRLREVKELVCIESRSESLASYSGGPTSTNIMRTYQLVAIWELPIPESEDHQ